MGDPEDEDRWRRETKPVAGEEAPTVPATPPSRPPALQKSSAFDPPRRDRFEEKAELGRGGMGRVFEAMDTALDRPVAIKQSLTDDEAMLVRFEREVRITARLQHPGIVPILDAGRDDEGRPFYVMRKIEGQPLAQLIAQATSRAERLALVPRLLAAIDAMAYAHARGVIHRDLKPWNVLLGPFGETLVIDWGLARELDEPDLEVAPVTTPADVDDGLTRAGHAYGTPGFMAPEQARGEPLDRRADVYALGAMLFHALAGQVPFAGITPTQAIDRAATGALPDFAKIPDGTPAELTAIVAKAMAPTRDARYADASELATDVRRFTTGQLVTAHHYSLGQLVGRWLKRHRLVVTTGSLAVIAVAVVGIVAVRRVIEARDRADAARAAETERGDELLVERADAIVDADPDRALAELKQLRPGTHAWSHVPAIIETAALRGTSWGQVAHHGVPAMSIAASPDGSRVASAAIDGPILVHDPSLHTPAQQLAVLDQPDVLAWIDREDLAVVDLDEHLSRLDRGTSATRSLAGVAHVGELVGVHGGRVYVIGRDLSLRVVDPKTDAVIATIADVHDSLLIPTGLVYATRTEVIYLPDGGAPSVLASVPSTELVELAASYDGQLVAAAIGDVAVEWKLEGPGLVERARWAFDRHEIMFSGRTLFALGGFAVQWLIPGSPPRRQPSPIDIARARVQTATDTFVSGWDGSLWRFSDRPTRIGGMTEPISVLVVAGDYLVGASPHGSLRSWDLRPLRPPSIKGPDQTILPAGLSAGRMFVESEGETVLVDASNGARTRIGDVQAVCVGPRYAMLVPRDGRPNYERLDLVTLERTTISRTAQGLACSVDTSRIALVDPQRIEIRDLAAPDRVAAVVAPQVSPFVVHVEGSWLVVASETGDIERIDLVTSARQHTRVTGAIRIAIDETGRVAIVLAKSVQIWDGTTLATVPITDVLSLRPNPAGFVGVTREHVVVVIDAALDLRTYHEGTAYEPTFAATLPLAAIAGGDGSPKVIDLRDGQERRFPSSVSGAWISVDGTQLLGGMVDSVLVWPIDPPADAATLRARLDQLTNATITPGSTRVTFPDR